MSLIKILIADDEPTVLEIMSRKVASAGYDVISAQNGKEAWNKVISENPDMIITDLIMPEMDGFAMLSQLRRNPPTNKWVPVIVVSSMDEMQNMQKCFDLQADHYLIKPCRIEDILKAIKLMLSLIPLRNS
jgi:two-component system response regulator MprA